MISGLSEFFHKQLNSIKIKFFMRHFHFFGGKTDLRGLCSVIGELVAVVVAHDHVHHSLHEGLEDIVIEVLNWLNEGLECLAKSKS